MKTKISLYFFLFTACCLMTTAQVPQGFNYQAIVRNSSGDVLQNKTLKVTVTIKTALNGGIVIREEYHNVTSNQFGLVSFAVGSGTYISGVTSFDLIDWKVQPLYLKTTVEYPVGTVTEMGTAPILSVPYSLVAKDVEGPVGKLDIRGSESSVDSALFEVKNKNGNTVFAVYPEGVRVYVADGAKGKKGGFAVGSFGTGKAESQKYFVVSKDSIRMYLDSNPATKKPKGGFAVGGYDMAKGIVQDYLDVSEDSVRIYIDNNPLTKGKKGGFAVGGYDMAKNGITNFFNVAIDTTDIIKPSQNRILWYPQKNAFMTGKVLIENKDSVGVNSFASGFESKAKGKYSQALGYMAIARGDYSTAIGKNAMANNINSFAFGESAQAANDESYAFGRGAIASGYRSFAFGSAGVDNDGKPTDVAKASGDYSFALGQGSVSAGKGSFSIGIADTATGIYSTAIGYQTSSKGTFSTAIGLGSSAKGDVSTAMGWYPKANGFCSVALGAMPNALNNHTIALGYYPTASGDYSIAIGYVAHATGTSYGSTAIGYQPTASGDGSTALGFMVNATGDYSSALGRESTASGTWSTAIGYKATAGATSTAIGYVSAADLGSISIGSFTTANAFNTTAIGHGARAYGQYSTSLGISTLANGTGATAIGYATKASGNYSTSLGYSSQATGYYSTATGYSTKSKPFASFVVGQWNDTTCSTSGNTTWVSSDPLFICGNGTSSSSLSNALTVYKNGFTDIAGGELRIRGANYPSTGSGVEIYYYGGTGIMQCYDRSAGVYKPLYIYTAQVRPITDNAYALGASSYRWTAVYAANGTIQTSDRRMKENIIPVTGGLETILNLSPVSFIWKDKSDDTRHIGLIAQEVLPVIPEIVDIGDDPDQTLGINYSGLVPVLVSAIKEQQKQIESYKSQLQTLQEKVNKIEELLTRTLDE